ncbi:MAG: PAS domain-containing protein, partial [Elusimicrobia bacterium]|nr:PAS domain-containing protein [Elusimicrobiota bacterium]
MGTDVEHALWVASERLTGLTGQDFLDGLAEELGSTLGVAFVLVSARPSSEAERATALAFARQGRLAGTFEYALAGTPCALVLEGTELAVADRVQERFPAALSLRELGARAFAGVPMTGRAGRVLGQLAVLHDKALPEAADLLPLLRRLAARAASELERLEEEDLLTEVCEAITQVFWISDPERRRVLYVSPGYEAVWGRSVESLYREPRSWLEAVHEQDRARLRDAEAALKEHGSYDLDYRVLRPDGEVRMVRDRAYPVRGPHGEVVRVCGVAEDVTERRREQAELEQGRRLA